MLGSRRRLSPMLMGAIGAMLFCGPSIGAVGASTATVAHRSPSRYERRGKYNKSAHRFTGIAAAKRQAKKRRK